MSDKKFPASARNIFYHGSARAGIEQLTPRSILHGTEESVVYLTDCIPYALTYIWDERHIGCAQKHVTAWVQNGVTYYEEQFPDQLKTFYKGASGYLYILSARGDVEQMERRHGIFYSRKPAEVEDVLPIPDVYEVLLRYEALGQLRVLHYPNLPQQRREELIEVMAEELRKEDFYCNDRARAEFMQKYFPAAWNRAREK